MYFPDLFNNFREQLKLNSSFKLQVTLKNRSSIFLQNLELVKLVIGIFSSEEYLTFLCIQQDISSFQ